MLRFVREEPPLTTTAHAAPTKRRPITVFGAVILAFGAVALFARLRSPLPLAAYDDDAFYYFQIARNIATGHGSTFDGIHLTNGYHPLWMLLCVVAAWIAKGKAFFVLLQCIAFLSLATSYFAARSLFRLVRAEGALADVAAAAVALSCLVLIHGGMEITLTLPLALVLCLFRMRPAFDWNPQNAAGYGGIAALVVLSRLDSFLWVALLLCAEILLARRNSSRLRSVLLGALIGALPLALYALGNHHWFHVWMPVSATAKQLRPHHGFTLTGLRGSLYLLQEAYGLLLVYPALLLMLCAVIAMVIPRQASIRPDLRALAITLLLFPVVQLATLCFLSDWQIWSWYLYSFALATVGALLYLLAAFPEKGLFANKEFSLLAGVVVLLLGILYSTAEATQHQVPHWTIFANDLADFARTHPGVYAMGDCAGTTGYLLQQPLIQTEGLVMDDSFLDNIRRQDDLRPVLQRYDVHYYVTFQAIAENGCYRVQEPFMAGPESPRMRTTLCQEPVASYPVGPAVLRIFDLQPTAQ